MTTAIVEAVAEYEEVRPGDLPRLADELDRETFQRLTAQGGRLTEPLTFEYLWYRITVLPGGEVVVTP